MIHLKLFGNNTNGGVQMSKESKKRVHSEERFSLLSRSLLTGFIGGLLWSTIGSIFYYFNFSEVAPKSFLLTSWIDAAWTDKWIGTIITILIAGLISIVAAFIYYGVFKKIDSLWMGVLYGLLLWGIIFIVLQPIFPNIPPFTELTLDTHISALCLFILYGTFVGYSISYDYNDMYKNQVREETQ